ncbi:TadE/TadG family type IV pilus assembly protein [Lutibaculum baratangense]|uniref:TadE-like domain-containing protein n=1 Tax=Lutibaculum baratangense AMV1 TaxID=631454 RepID=V4RHK6_9HYPH|nr:TadE/TadG family type IV pilus assembly protein [Lutibaculum baratangense]ESR24829.1 hypothetical protein N177_2152 [Lutibaculum baratangense AMV1]
MLGVRNMMAELKQFRDERGVSAVEFALILPILVLLYLGCVELSHALTVDRKVTTAASVVGDLVAQATQLSNADIRNIFDATDAVLTPYDAAPLEIVVSNVRITQNGTEVLWSEASGGGTARGCGSSMNLPDNIRIEGTSLVVAEVKYRYKPTFGNVIKEAITFSDTFYLRPRRSAVIEHSC